MTDENQIEDQDIELHDEVTDDGIMEKAGHDPKNAPDQAVAATDKAGDAAGDAKDRPTDNTTQDPMPKTKAGMINAMNMKMMNAKKMDIQSMYQSVMKPESYKAESVESDDQPQLVEYQADFEEDQKSTSLTNSQKKLLN